MIVGKGLVSYEDAACAAGVICFFVHYYCVANTCLFRKIFILILMNLLEGSVYLRIIIHENKIFSEGKFIVGQSSSLSVFKRSTGMRIYSELSPRTLRRCTLRQEPMLQFNFLLLRSPPISLNELLYSAMEQLDTKVFKQKVALSKCCLNSYESKIKISKCVLWRFS